MADDNNNLESSKSTSKADATPKKVHIDPPVPPPAPHSHLDGGSDADSDFDDSDIPDSDDVSAGNTADTSDQPFDVVGGRAKVIAVGDKNYVLVQRADDQGWYTFSKSEKQKDYAWYQTIESPKKEKLETYREDFFWNSTPKSLGNLYLQALNKRKLIHNEEFAEPVTLLLEQQQQSDWSSGAKATVVGGALILGGVAGALGYHFYGPKKTVTNNVPGPTVYVDKWNWNNSTEYVSDIDLERAVTENCSDVFTGQEIAVADNATLRNWLAKDGLADVLTADKQLWQDIQNVDKNVSKRDLYFSTWADIASLVQKAGYNSGFAEGKAAADAAVAAIYDKVSADAKKLIPEFADADWKPYADKTINNIMALEKFIAVDPHIDGAFADADQSEFFNYTHFAKKAAYTDATLQDNIQSSIEYKADKHIVSTLDENDFGASERAVTLNYLAQYHAQYPWLVLGLDETNASQKANLRTLLEEQGDNVSASLKQAINQGDMFYAWTPSADISAPMMYAKDTDSLYKITDTDVKLLKQYLLEGN